MLDTFRSRPTAGLAAWHRWTRRCEAGDAGAASARAERRTRAGHAGGTVVGALVAWLRRRRLVSRGRQLEADPHASGIERREALAAPFSGLCRSTGDGPNRIDALTGLPNPHHLSDLAGALARLQASAAIELCVLRLDLDGFRAVNERFGRTAGDSVLRSVAARLRAAARDDDVVLRLGGDEFAVIAPCAVGRGDALAERMTARFLEQLRQPFRGSAIAGLGLGGCIGTARWRPGQAPLLESIAQAGEALLAAKRAGRCQRRHYAARHVGRPKETESAARVP